MKLVAKLKFGKIAKWAKVINCITSNIVDHTVSKLYTAANPEYSRSFSIPNKQTKARNTTET